MARRKVKGKQTGFVEPRRAGERRNKARKAAASRRTPNEFVAKIMQTPMKAAKKPAAPSR